MLDDLTNRDQRMMFGLVTMVHLADTKEQLDSDTETILTTAGKHLCQMSVLRWQQKDGLDTVLPYGLRKIQTLRTLTTESTTAAAVETMVAGMKALAAVIAAGGWVAVLIIVLVCAAAMMIAFFLNSADSFAQQNGEKLIASDMGWQETGIFQ